MGLFKSLLAATVFVTFSSSVSGEKHPERPEWAGIWGIWGGQNYGGPDWPWYKGTIVHTTWAEIEPTEGQWDFSEFNEHLKEAADRGLFIGVKVYHGNGTPEWVYDKGVPRVENTKGKVYPYYLDPEFQPLLFRMIREVAANIRTLTPEILERIVVLQAPAGKSGDPQPYQGIVPEEFRIDWAKGEEWRDWNQAVFREYADAFSDLKDQLTIIIKPNEELHDHFLNEMPSLGRKTWSTAQGYQANSEMNYEWLREDLMATDRLPILRGRGEFDHAVREQRPWFVEAPAWNMYWQCLWMLTYGLDMFNQRTQTLDDPGDYIEAFSFFSQFAGYKNPATSPSAWCALRDGLDYLDTERFPETTFGEIADGKNPKRYRAILKVMAPFGAKNGDAEMLETGTHSYYQRLRALNDVAYNIWPGNYRNFLYEIDPQEHGQGYWRVGPKEQPYGRFARGFNHSARRDALYFDLDDKFFRDGQNVVKSAKVRVVYFDEGTGSWSISYDGIDDSDGDRFTVKKTDSGLWKEVVFLIEDGRFANQGSKGSDIALIDVDQEDDIFHMVQFLRLQDSP
ncbi:MAG: hypothetical protein AAGA96_14040 [Verrucomicrobiota bacterium]